MHVDAQRIVINKPAGLLAVPGRGEDKQDCAWARVQAVYPDALVVHRLDQATSGLLVFARGEAMQRALSAAFAQRQVDKRYEAVVHGLVAQEQFEIDLPLIADWPHRPRQKVDHEHGKPSLTRVRVVSRHPGLRAGHLADHTAEHIADHHAAGDGVSPMATVADGHASGNSAASASSGAPAASADRTRLWLEPVTGRSHQLRVHLLAVGHPILGDALYAPPDALSQAPRLLLHARDLTLPPLLGEAALTLHSPADF
ncbi:ribosomal large subunit pseudouridine synthase A [Roseateles sp. YR242]|nr:ribosomal large subunit pseudouridine synthase A [Roseateles sp. YR242]